MMKYIDLHCDALTKYGGVFHVTRQTLQAGGCMLQCFAAFVPDPFGGLSDALALAEKFDAVCAVEGYRRVRRASDLCDEKINALLTVEGGGAIEGRCENLETLYARGVRAMTLTWNHPNAIGFPNYPDYENLRKKDAARREKHRGLTPFGFEAVERMHELGMLVDVSHGSDALFYDVAAVSRARGVPFIASHSGANAVHACARNLTDGEIGLLADCGGVVGLCFCAEFLSERKDAAGQREALLAHARHIVEKGGEDVLALGSDFDGIPQNAFLRTAADVPLLLDDLERAFGARVAEKIACGNALRVFKAVLRES